MQAGRWLASFVFACSLISPHLKAEPLGETAGTLGVCRAGVSSALAKAERLRGGAAVSEAGVLPNPSLKIEHQRTLSGPTDRETILGLSVPLGIGGRRWLLQDVAEARRRRSFAEAHATLFEAALAFREAYVTAVIDQARSVVLSEQQAALDALSATLQKLAKAGEAAAYDGLRQSTQARLHRQSWESAKAKASSSRILLEAWTEREVTLPAAEPSALGGGVRASSPTMAAGETPRVQSLEDEGRASELEAEAARRRWVPDLSVFAGYRAVTAGSETGHGLALGLELPLSFFDHGQGEAARADAEGQLARALASRLKRQNGAQLKAAATSLVQLEASLGEAEAASRDAQTVREKAAQLYAAGEVSITELLEAYRAAEEAKLAKLALEQEIALTRLALMRAAGTMFDAKLDRECQGTQGGGR